jgi:hypothetical protein
LNLGPLDPQNSALIYFTPLLPLSYHNLPNYQNLKKELTFNRKLIGRLKRSIQKIYLKELVDIYLHTFRCDKGLISYKMSLRSPHIAQLFPAVSGHEKGAQLFCGALWTIKIDFIAKCLVSWSSTTSMYKILTLNLMISNSFKSLSRKIKGYQKTSAHLTNWKKSPQ